jgi:hypothetical protein
MTRLFEQHSVFITIVFLLSSMASIAALYFYLNDKYFDKVTIQYSFMTYESGNIKIYRCRIKNNSSHGAKDFNVRGSFKSHIVKAELFTNESKTEKLNEPDGHYEFTLRRLSRNSECKFDILVDAKNDLISSFKATWDKDDELILNLQPPDDRIVEGGELERKAVQYNKDLSLPARKKWLKDNSTLR